MDRRSVQTELPELIFDNQPNLIYHLLMVEKRLTAVIQREDDIPVALCPEVNILGQGGNH